MSEISPIYIDNIPPLKGNARMYTPLSLQTAAQIRDLQVNGHQLAFVKATLGWYYQDTTDTTSPDDGVSCIRDADGFAWKFLNFGVGGDLFDHYGHTADRSTYNAEPAGTTFFDVDAFDGDGGWYVRITVTPGTWAGPFRFQGPSGIGDRMGLHVNFEYRPTTAQVLIRWRPAPDEIITFAADFENSVASFDLGSAAPATFIVTRNDIEVGNCLLAAPSNTLGVWETASHAPLTFNGANGDVLKLLAPDPQDVSLAQGSITLIGNR